MNKKSFVFFLIIILVVAVGGSFFAGMKYQASKIPTRNFAGGQPGNQFRQRNGANGQAVRGQILDASADSLTVKLTDGSSVIVLLSAKTTIGKMTTGAKSDLKTGETVSAFGAKNADGSVTADNIQIGSPKP